MLVFGPSKYASQLESSKEFSKLFMKRNNIPTASFESFTNYENARSYLDNSPIPIVIKADGLASGKGVKVCFSKDEAFEFLKEVMQDKVFSTLEIKLLLRVF